MGVTYSLHLRLHWILEGMSSAILNDFATAGYEGGKEMPSRIPKCIEGISGLDAHALTDSTRHEGQKCTFNCLTALFCDMPEPCIRDSEIVWQMGV